MLIFQGVIEMPKKAALKEKRRERRSEIGDPNLKVRRRQRKVPCNELCLCFQYTPLEVGDITMKLFEEESLMHQYITKVVISIPKNDLNQ